MHLLLLSLALAHAPLPDALEQLGRAIAQEPESAALHIERHRLHLESGDREAAALDLVEAEQHGAQVAALRGLLRGDLVALNQALASGESEGPWAQVYAARAALLLADGEWALALDDMDRAVALDPTPDRYLARASMAQAHDPERAISGLIGSPGVACQLRLVELLRAQSRGPEAREIVDSLLLQSPEHPGWLLLRAQLSGIWGGPYRRRARAVLERRVAESARPADIALLEQAQGGGCAGGSGHAALLWLTLLWRRRCC